MKKCILDYTFLVLIKLILEVLKVAIIFKGIIDKKDFSHNII